MRKFLSLFMVIAFAIAILVGCGNNEKTLTKQETPTEVNTPLDNTKTEVNVTKYTVSFVTNTTTELASQSVEKATDITLNVLTNDGFTFNGWFLDSEFNTPFDQRTYTLSSDITLYASWTENKTNTYIVTFKVDGLVLNAQFVNEGESALAPVDPVKTGYIFTGWDSDFSNVTSDLTINALFDKASFTVTFEVDGETISTQSVLYGENAVAPADPVKEGYTFKNWDKDYTNVSSDLVVKAKFTVTTFTVTFLIDSDATYNYDIQEVEYGEDAETPFPPTKEGYDFTGWDKEYTNVTSDLTITGTWTIKKLVIKYYVDGIFYTEVEVNYGEAPTAPDNPVKEGYEFTGWGSDFSNITSVTYNLTFHASFTPKTYSIKYFDNDGNELSYTPTSYKTGDNFELPKYEVSDYIFAGWYLDSEHKTSTLGAITEKQYGDLTLYPLNVKVDLTSYDASWSFTGFTTTNTAAKGLDAVSTLPSQYERDFYNYLESNNLLNDSRIDDTMKVSSWAEFSAVNPRHSGDPQRIWNDTSTNYVGGANGYSALFLFDSISLDSNGYLVDINGGFLGSEPYKTKYWNLTYMLVQMVQYKYSTVDFTVASAVNNGYFAFVIDGYFYGTQGVSDGLFKAFRNVCPTTTTYYKYENNVATAYTREYKNTTDFSSINKALAIPVCDGKVFDGWYLDSELTKSVTDNPVPSLATLYPKFK